MEDPPDIHEFFDDALWEERFDEESREAGRRLRPKVRELAGEWVDAENFVLRAGVAGAACEVTLWPGEAKWDFESQCECEAGRFCAHAAAMLEEAGKGKNLSRLLEGRSARTVAPTTSAVQAADPGETAYLETKPSFQLRITREPTETKVVRLLLQALKIPDSGDWVGGEAAGNLR